MADVGIGPSVSKHTAQFSVSDDRFTVRAVTTIGVLYYALVSGVVLLIAQIAGPLLLSHLSLTPELRFAAETVRYEFSAGAR